MGIVKEIYHNKIMERVREMPEATLTQVGKKILAAIIVSNMILGKEDDKTI